MTDKILGRDDLLSGNHLKRELVPVPELEGSLYLRELSTPQMLEFYEAAKQFADSKGEVDVKGNVMLMAMALAMSACNENGDLLFNKDDVEKLLGNKIDVLMRLSTHALEMSGMNDDVQEVAANLKKVRQTSSSISSAMNSKRRKRN